MVPGQVPCCITRERVINFYYILFIFIDYIFVYYKL